MQEYDRLPRAMVSTVRSLLGGGEGRVLVPDIVQLCERKWRIGEDHRQLGKLRQLHPPSRGTMYPDSEIEGMLSRSLRLLNWRTAPTMGENMVKPARTRTANDMILEKAIDPLAIETSGESRGTKA